jgi:hypothetical protein
MGLITVTLTGSFWSAKDFATLGKLRRRICRIAIDVPDCGETKCFQLETLQLDAAPKNWHMKPQKDLSPDEANRDEPSKCVPARH